jgi:hypothetical protein
MLTGLVFYYNYTLLSFILLQEILQIYHKLCSCQALGSLLEMLNYIFYIILYMFYIMLADLYHR